jgi:protein gp37
MAKRQVGMAAAKKTWSKYLSTVDSNGWTGEIGFDERSLEIPLHWKKPRRVFVGSMGDLFHPNMPFEVICRIFDTIKKCPQHTFQILTKRPELVMNVFEVDDQWPSSAWPPNAWLGVSCEDQARADRRIDDLLNITQFFPDLVTFVSIEPMLGLVDVEWDIVGIDWVIVGGESGPRARPMHPDLVRKVRDDCKYANVPFFFKGWGDWLPGEPDGVPYYGFQNNMWIDSNSFPDFDDPKTKKWLASGENEYPAVWQRVGKKKAGRLLDGVEHNAFPAV